MNDMLATILHTVYDLGEVRASARPAAGDAGD